MASSVYLTTLTVSSEQGEDMLGESYVAVESTSTVSPANPPKTEPVLFVIESYGMFVFPVLPHNHVSVPLWKNGFLTKLAKISCERNNTKLKQILWGVQM